MTPTEHIRATRELLSVPERHTKKAIARTAAGDPCVSSSERATSWCLRGALLKTSGDDEAVFNAATLRCQRAARIVYPEVASAPCPLIKVNDDLGYSAVLKVLDTALSPALEGI